MKKRQQLLAWMLTFVLTLVMMPGVNLMAAGLIGEKSQENITGLPGKRYTLSELKAGDWLDEGDIITGIPANSTVRYWNTDGTMIGDYNFGEEANHVVNGWDEEDFGYWQVQDVGEASGGGKYIPLQPIIAPKVALATNQITTTSAQLQCNVTAGTTNIEEKALYLVKEKITDIDTFDLNSATLIKKDQSTLVAQSNDVFKYSLENLDENTTYTAIFEMKDEYGHGFTYSIEFTTLQVPVSPTVTKPSVNVSKTVAQLSATIALGTSSENDLTDYGFEYKLKSANDWTKIDSASITKNALNMSFSLENLKKSTSYEVRSYITVAGQTIYSDVTSFKTKSSSSSSSSSSSNTKTGSKDDKTSKDDKKIIISNNVKVPYTDNGDGTGTIELTDELIKQLIDSRGYLSLNLSSSSLEGWFFVIPGEWFSQEGKIQGLVIKGFSDIVINDKMLRNIDIKPEDRVVISIKKGSIIIGMQVNSKKVNTVDKSHPIYVAYNHKASSMDENSVIIQKDNKNTILPLCIPNDETKQILFLTPSFGEFEMKDNHKSFSDVAGHKAEKAINFVSARELLTGVTEDTFSPEGSMTRGMFVTILGRLYGADTTKTASFSDVEASAYYAPYVAWASENHIVDGIGNNKFAPEKPVTHEQMAKILCNYMSYAEQKLPKVEGVSAYNDAQSIESWAKEGVEVLQSNGIFEGAMETNFMPKTSATRAEISTVLMNYINALVKEAGKLDQAQ